MINCIIVDDEQHAIDLLANHISKIPLLDLRFATTQPLQAFQYLQQHKAGLVFLDIQMPELDGMRFLKLLRGKSKVILTTAYAEYALEGYEHDIVDYLLKPIVFDRFLKAVQKAMDVLNSTQHAQPVSASEIGEGFIFVKAEGRGKIVRILLDEIEYIEGLGNYLSIYTTNSRVVTLLTIKELEEQLPPGRFARIHNSYIVPISKITEVEGNQLLIGKQRLPLGDVYKKTFLRMIEKHLMRNRK